MPLDGISARSLKNELLYELKDAKVDKIYQPNRFTILLHFRTRKVMKKLLLSANPASPRLFLTSRDYENPKMPPAFCMLLRKYLSGATLLDIEQPEYERVFLFKFLTNNELGDSVVKTLAAEIMGRYSNLILLNEADKIHDAIVHVDQDISSKREIMPARAYELPPQQNKWSIDYYLAAKDEILPFLADETEKLSVSRSVLNHVLGFSPLLANAVVDQAGIDSRLHVDQLTLTQKKSVSDSFYQIAEMIAVQADCPSLYFRSEHDTKPFDFHAFLLPEQPFYKKISTLSMAMDVFYSLQDQDHLFSQKQAQLERLLQQTIQHVQKKLDFHQKDYQAGLQAEKYKKLGELLNSQLYLVKDGAAEAEVIDYYDPEQKTLTIPLKAHLTPADNAAVYFKKYRKAQSKLASAERFLAEDQAELQWLFSLITALDKAESMEDLAAIDFEIRQTEKTEKKPEIKEQENPKHLLQNALNPGKPGKKSKKYMRNKQQNQKKKSKVKQAKPLPIRKFEIDQGIMVYAGRNNLQNDELSLHFAGPDDLWFHAKEMTGTHVLLRAEGNRDIEDQHVEQAAQIAAWYSESNKIKTGSGDKIPVDCCLAKYVKKPKGAKPGMVIYTHFKTYFVKPQLPE